MAQQYETHKFFCIKCGKEGIPIARKCGQLRSGEHRKKLWCLHCKCEINHIECRTEAEITEFKERWAKGDFREEAENSLDHVRHSWLW